MSRWCHSQSNNHFQGVLTMWAILPGLQWYAEQTGTEPFRVHWGSASFRDGSFGHSLEPMTSEAKMAAPQCFSINTAIASVISELKKKNWRVCFIDRRAENCTERCRLWIEEMFSKLTDLAKSLMYCTGGSLWRTDGLSNHMASNFWKCCPFQNSSQGRLLRWFRVTNPLLRHVLTPNLSYEAA